jgi:hypothetical protein
MDRPPRSATLVLVTPDGSLLGALPDFVVETPWWQEAGPVVRGARARHGIEVTVLRILDTEFPEPPGGRVTYLVETTDDPEVTPWDGALDEHPLRLGWARAGGPGRDLDWARAALVARGRSLDGRPEQIRSWNLSSLWRLPTDGGATWLKVVPPFFAHEGAVLRLLAGRHPVPPPLAHDGPRLLLDEIPGHDLYDAPLPRLLEMVDLLVAIQADSVGDIGTILDAGAPDWRGPALTAAIAAVLDRTGPELSGDDRAVLDPFVAGLDDRFAAIAAAGLPDTVVHGDFHPGNLRGDGETLVLLDWGDSGVGHPLLDEAAFCDRMPAAGVAAVRAHWHAAWRRCVPGADPDRAADLVGPIAAARQAVIYRRFLDAIEPSEHPYHRSDPGDWLRRTAALLRAEAPRAAAAPL